MTRRFNAILATVLSVVSLAAGAANTPVTPADNLQLKIEEAANGDTLELAPGIYTPVGPGTAFPDANTFNITRQVRIVGMGTSPGAVTLRGGAAGDYAVKYWRYNVTVPASTPPDPSNGSLENLTIDGAPGGIQIFDFNPATLTNLSGIVIKNVVINTKNPGTSNVFGVLLKDTKEVVLDKLNVTSYASGFFLLNAKETLLMNSTLNYTVENVAVGVSILGGSENRIVNNIFGSVKADPSALTGYSFATDTMDVFNSSENRIENNTLQGHKYSGLSLDARDGSLYGLPAAQQYVRSLNNYAGKNNVISTGFAAGLDDGGGFWVNCSSDSTWLYGNEAQGGAEAGVFVWLSSHNMVLANSFHNNKKIGITVSGGSETPSLCDNPAYQVKPASNYVHSNYVYYNRNDQVTIRNANSTEISRNFVSPRNGFGGPLQACLDTFCQSAFSLETDASDNNSNGFRVVANTSAENIRGVYNNDGKVTGLEFYFNRMITSTVRSSVSRFVTATPLTIDFGAMLGGNFWDRHTAFGNPSTSSPYSGVFQDLANDTGLVVDRYPYQSEDFGRGQSVTVFEPRPNLSAAQGTRKTVRWHAPGCTLLDVLLDGTTNLVTNTSSTGSNAPNTGYAVITIPDSAVVGSHTIVVNCKDSAGNVKGQGSSQSFNVTSSALQLVTPGRDDVFDANQTIFVAWKKTAAVSSVNIEFSSDGGSNFTTLLTGVTGNFARVTLPNISSTAYAMIRIVSASGTDYTDGVFALRGASGAGFTNVSAGRKFVMGQLERLEWASPQGSRLVDITATVGGPVKTVASNLPDRGSFDWVLPDMGTGPLSLAITFKSSSGTTIPPLSSTVAGSTLFPTTITFGTTPAIAPGESQPITATTNSGLGLTFTTLTPSICTVSGTTVTAGATAGTCSIAADQGGNSTYAAAPQVILSFTVGQSQTISFGAAPLVVVNGTGTVSATASSGLTVSFSTTTPSVCTVLAAMVSGLAAGTCTVAANQEGNGTFSPAPQATQSFSVVVATDIPRLANISTRALVETGDNVMIGGFIVGGSAPKKVLITARGPFMAGPPYNVLGTLANPQLQLFAGGTPILYNDDWQLAANSTEIALTGLAPTKTAEAAILTIVNPGVPYTAIVTGVGGTTGVALVEVFEVDHPEFPLLNISTRGIVRTGDNVLIGGFIIQGSGPQQVLITARGPSLGQPPFNVPGTLADPTLDLYQQGTINPIESNDNWVDSPNAAAIQATGNAPSNPLESAIIRTLQPGAYSAIVRGKNGGTGVGLVEVYAK